MTLGHIILPQQQYNDYCDRKDRIMEDIKKNNKPRRPYINGMRVAYVIGESKPKTRAPWQLKLQAISDCNRFMTRDNYKDLVEQRYQELLHKEG